MSGENRDINEWDVAAESWIDFVGHGKDYFRDELNNPGMFMVIGDLRGLAVLDVACGEGYNTRLLAGKGAKVSGIDSSEKLIDFAICQEEKDPFGIEYYVLNSSDLSMFSTGSFDLVTCFMALMDIRDYDQTISEIARVTRDGGRFVFSITHPCFEYNSKTQVLERPDKYFEAKPEKVLWNLERLLRPFETTSFHRTLTDYSTALYKHGFLIRRLIEPKPTRKGLKKFPQLKQILLTPHSICTEAVKISCK